jgi:transcriptional regulator with XRE-family HTH domain
MDVPTTQFLTGTELLSKAMRDIRKKRGLKTSEVARRMGMSLRSYEHFEAGRGRISYERLLAFAEATDSDPYALLAVVAFESPEFALRSADNRLMHVMMLTLKELNEELGEDIAYLETRTLIAAFTRLTKDLIDHVRKRDTFAEEWLAERTTLKPRKPGGGSR